MNTKNLTFILLNLAVTTSSFAQGSANPGHGGGAYVCYDTAAELANAEINPSDRTGMNLLEMYDLWEGENISLPKLNIPPAGINETRQQILDRMVAKVARIAPGLAKNINDVLPWLHSEDHLSPLKNTKLKTVNDISLDGMGEYCTYHQMVNWLDANAFYTGSKEVILRDETFYNGMYPLEQAALDFHEAAYKVARSYDQKYYDENGSGKVRRFVAEVFSDSKIETRIVDPTLIEPGIYAIQSTDHWRAPLLKIRIVPEQSTCETKYIQLTHSCVKKSGREVQRGVYTLNDFGSDVRWYCSTGAMKVTIKGCGLSEFTFTTDGSWYPGGVAGSRNADDQGIYFIPPKF